LKLENTSAVFNNIKR